MDDALPIPNVVVGVTLQQTEVVLLEAAMLADRLGATLICAHVDASRYVTDVMPDGSVLSIPIDPGLVGAETVRFDPELAERVERVLAQQTVPAGRERPVLFRALVGDPALALARLAETARTTYLVIGSRRTGVRAGMKEFFGGSIAVHLVHRQSRPVLVIPVSPIRQDRPLPWEG